MTERQQEPSAGSSASRRAFEAIAAWVAALHGRGELDGALGRIAALLGGEAAAAARLTERDGRIRQIAVSEPRSRLSAVSATGPSVGFDLLGESFDAFRPGSVTVFSELRRDADFGENERIAERLAAGRIGDLALLVLEAKDGAVDCLECRFAEPMRRRDRLLLAEMAPALTAAWVGRLPGTVERLLARRRFRQEPKQAPLGADILDASNPLGLTRSEYRICALVREGLVAKAIARELDLQESTVRSHLRAIYAKTGASGHVDLLHRLTTRAPKPWPSALSA